MAAVQALTIVLLALLGNFARAQCPVQNDDDAPPSLASALTSRGDEQVLPESGYLSDHTYASVFFGFELELPIGPNGHRMMLPLTPPGQHALLGLAFENEGREGSIIIVASEPANPQYKMTEAERREEFSRWAQSKPSLHREMPDWMMRSGHIYHTEKRRGEMLTMQFSTRIRNYTIRVKVDSNDQEFSKKAKRLVDAMHFYCPREDGTLTNAKGDPVLLEGTPCSGPTIPTWRVDARLAEKPQEHAIPLGTVTGAVYRNPELGFIYGLPAGWRTDKAQATTAVSGTAQISTRNTTANTESRTQEYLNACSAILVHTTQDPNVALDHDARAQIILRALDPACLLLRGPDSIRDRQGAEELAAYLEMLGQFGEIQSSELVSVSGRLFAVYRGTVARRDGTADLASRTSELVFATRYNKLLLLWSLIVEKGGNLNSLPNTNVTFGDEAPIALGPALAVKK